MIIEIRNQLKGQGFKIVLWITLIAMALLFSPALFRRQAGARAAIATVNNNPIEVLPYERKVAQETERLSFFREQFGAQAEGVLQSLGLGDPKTVALQSLIQEELLNQTADALNIRISPEYIMQILQNPSLVRKELGDIVPLYLLDEEQKTINTMRLNQYLSRYRLTITDFEKSIENKLKRAMVLAMASASAYVSPEELKNYFIAQHLGKSFVVAQFPFDAFLTKAKETNPTAEEISSLFERQHKKYWIPEKRSGIMWEFSPDAYDIAVSTAQAEGYYHNQKAKKYVATPLQLQVKRILIKVPDSADTDAVKAAEEKAREIKQELANNPADFDRIVKELAKQYSDDKVSVSKGDDFFKKGDKDPAFERGAFRLQKDGDISDVLVTNEGFEILQRVARKPIVYKTFASVQPEIVAELKRQTFKTIFADDMSRFMNRSTAGDLLRQFALDKKAVSKTIELQENDNSPIIERLFKLRVGDWAFFVSNNKGYAVNLAHIEKSHKPELSQVENKVKADLFVRKAQELQQEALEKAKLVAKDQPFDILKKQFGVTITPYGHLKKSDNEILKNLYQEGVPVREMLSLEKQGSLGIAFDDQNSGYLIKLDTIEPFNNEAFEEQKPALLQELYNEQQSFIERGFVASLYRNATLNFIESLHNKQEENLPYE